MNLDYVMDNYINMEVLSGIKIYLVVLCRFNHRWNKFKEKLMC